MNIRTAWSSALRCLWGDKRGKRHVRAILRGLGVTGSCTCSMEDCERTGRCGEERENNRWNVDDFDLSGVVKRSGSW